MTALLLLTALAVTAHRFYRRHVLTAARAEDLWPGQDVR